jgi:hypothetical protein
MTEEERPWSLVVESDQVFSAKTGKWYTVRSTSLLPTGKVRIRFEGVAKPFEVPTVDPATGKPAMAKVRRGPTGEAVDIINEIMRSG